MEKVIFSNSLAIEWSYLSSYAASGPSVEFPYALTTKVCYIGCSQVYNSASNHDDGNERVRTYSLSTASFGNGSESSSVSIFYVVIGY